MVISTIHKAKGLEWDRVYLLSVNNYDFPSMQDYDRYISEKWFVRQNLNLEAEVLSLLEAVAEKDRLGLKKDEGLATLEARHGLLRREAAPFICRHYPCQEAIGDHLEYRPAERLPGSDPSWST